MHISSRTLQTCIKDCRRLYKENVTENLIIKSNKGYKLSNDYDEIMKYINEILANSKSMNKEVDELLFALNRKDKRNETIN